MDKSTEWKIIEGNLLSKWANKLDPKCPLPEYPRPQFKRNEWLNLNGLWDYSISSKKMNSINAINEPEGKILVPFCIESALSGVKKSLKPKQKLWYRRFFTIPSDWTSKENQDIILHFGAVDWLTNVWINGNKVGTHKGGYSTFSFDITQFISDGDENEIIVSVWDPTSKGRQERGKQTLRPFGVFYTSVSGIWQTVWLELVSKTRISNIKILTDIDNELIKLDIDLKNSKNNTDLVINIDNNEVSSTQIQGKTKINLEISIDNVKLWNNKNPYLYDLNLKIKNQNGVIDEVKSYFGMRKISLKKDEKGILRIALNNKILFQYGPLDQGYWPDGIYTAPTDDALKYDIEVTKDMGFNMIRKHIKIEPLRWYHHCDKLGMLVWQDMPNGGMVIPGAVSGVLFKGKIYIPFGRFKKSVKNHYYDELKVMINNLYNIPSIVIWVPFNEGWGQFNTKYVANLTKKIDPYRIVNCTSGWIDKNVGDLRDVHKYPGPGMPKLENKRAVINGEFGGLGLEFKKHSWNIKFKWGYKKFDDIDDYKKKYEKLVKKLKELKEKGLAAAVYTQTTDVEGEINGLLTYDREIIKMDIEELKKLNKSVYE